MLKNSNNFNELNITYQVGSVDVLNNIDSVNALVPFAAQTIDFLNLVSKNILADAEAKSYPDVITLAFWIRRASIEGLKKRFAEDNEHTYRMGRGVAFHIAPSNVPVNYAYSFVSGMLCGNANVVRIPSKDYPQVTIINRAINKALINKPEMIPYIALIKYGHDSTINDKLSSIADVRIVWGGDATIKELRKSEIKARTVEITFADRYSLAVIDSDKYMEIKNKVKIANDFYNDTYFTDQNACTSPRVVAWVGSRINEAKEIFWTELHNVVELKYSIQGVQAVNKLNTSYLLSVVEDNVKRETSRDNLITRMKVKKVSSKLMEYKDNSGYFFEVDCKDVIELYNLCNDTRCQTVSYIGNKEMFLPLIKSGLKGIDRVVPIGKTMDFDFIWDGYNLFERMTRVIAIQ